MQKRQSTTWIPLGVLLALIIIAGTVTLKTRITGFAVAATIKDCKTNADCGTNGVCTTDGPRGIGVRGGKCLYGTASCNKVNPCTNGICMGNGQQSGPGSGWPNGVCVPGHIRDYVKDGGFCNAAIQQNQRNVVAADNECRPGQICVPLPVEADPGILEKAGLGIYNEIRIYVYRPGDVVRGVGVCMSPNPAVQAAQETTIKIQAPTCGNGKIDAGEDCDFASSNPDGPCIQSFTVSACKANCECSRPVGGGQASEIRCGNSQVDASEECDWSASQNTCKQNEFCYGCQCAKLG